MKKIILGVLLVNMLLLQALDARQEMMKRSSGMGAASQSSNHNTQNMKNFRREEISSVTVGKAAENNDYTTTFNAGNDSIYFTTSSLSEAEAFSLLLTRCRSVLIWWTQERGMPKIVKGYQFFL